MQDKERGQMTNGEDCDLTMEGALKDVAVGFAAFRIICENLHTMLFSQQAILDELVAERNARRGDVTSVDGTVATISNAVMAELEELRKLHELSDDRAAP